MIKSKVVKLSDLLGDFLEGKNIHKIKKYDDYYIVSWKESEIWNIDLSGLSRSEKEKFLSIWPKVKMKRGGNGS
ncbi:MAG: hypothetical protein ACOC80_14825 [Petrotogales bacterium]